MLSSAKAENGVGNLNVKKQLVKKRKENSSGRRKKSENGGKVQKILKYVPQNTIKFTTLLPKFKMQKIILNV